MGVPDGAPGQAFCEQLVGNTDSHRPGKLPRSCFCIERHPRPRQQQNPHSFFTKRTVDACQGKMPCLETAVQQQDKIGPKQKVGRQPPSKGAAQHINICLAQT
jgi:hypothetical protein